MGHPIFFPETVLAEIEAVINDQLQEEQDLIQSSHEEIKEISNNGFGSPFGSMTEVATDQWSLETSHANVSRMSQNSQKLYDALRRIRESPQTFGMCGKCKKPIPKERLLAIPYAVHHVDCEKGC